MAETRADRHWPAYVFGGRLRTSTLALILAFVLIWWAYESYGPAPDTSEQIPASEVVPPGFIPDPAYTWVPRTNVQRTPESSAGPTTSTSPEPDESVTDTPTSGQSPTPTSSATTSAPSSATTSVPSASSPAPATPGPTATTSARPSAPVSTPSPSPSPNA